MIVADDSVLLREGVTRLLENAGFEVVGHAADREELMRKARAHKPDVAIIDIRMPPTHTDEGLQAARAIREEMPGTGVRRPLGLHRRGVRAGAAGRGPRRSRLPAQGPRVGTGTASPRRFGGWPRAAQRSIPRSSRTCLDAGACTDPLEELTPREHDVLGLMAEGRSNQAIADALVISGRAVEKHVTSIFTKLDLPPAPEDHRRVLAVLAFLRS